MGSTDVLVIQPVSHLFTRAERNTPGNHSSVPLNSLPTAHAIAVELIVLHSCSAGWLMALLQTPGLAKGGAEAGCIAPCVQTLPLQVHAGSMHKISLSHALPELWSKKWELWNRSLSWKGLPKDISSNTPAMTRDKHFSVIRGTGKSVRR